MEKQKKSEHKGKDQQKVENKGKNQEKSESKALFIGCRPNVN